MSWDDSTGQPQGLSYACFDEGALRAYCDRELAPDDLARLAAHLGECAACHARYNEVAARAARVTSMMNALTAPAAVAPRRPATRRPWLRPVAGAALALAAAVALAFVLMPKRDAAPVSQPVARPHVSKPARPIQAGAPEPKAPAPERAARSKPTRRNKPARTEEFLALDDDPIELGVVMRVALDDNAAVQADVIFDADGRPRAIRPVASK